MGRLRLWEELCRAYDEARGNECTLSAPCRGLVEDADKAQVRVPLTIKSRYEFEAVATRHGSSSGIGTSFVFTTRSWSCLRGLLPSQVLPPINDYGIFRVLHKPQNNAGRALAHSAEEKSLHQRLGRDSVCPASIITRVQLEFGPGSSNTAALSLLARHIFTVWVEWNHFRQGHSLNGSIWLVHSMCYLLGSWGE